MAAPTVARRAEYDVSAAVPAATSPPTAASDVPKARRVAAAATAGPTETF